MTARRSVQIGTLRVTAPEAWRDVTTTVEGDAPPFTLAKDDGVGALQFSVADYAGGHQPNPTPEELEELVLDFGSARSLGSPVPGSCRHGQRAVAFATAQFRDDGDFIQAWYLAGKGNIALVTYVCEWSDRMHEAKEVDEMVSTGEFS